MKPVELFLSLRFIRSKRDVFFSLTSFLSIASVALSISVLLVILSITSGFQIELRERLIGAGAHINIEKIGGITNLEKDRRIIRANSEVISASPYIGSQGFLDINGDLQFVSFTGITAQLDKETTNLSKRITSGTFNANGNKIIIGSELAERFNLKVGDPVSIFLPQHRSKHPVHVSGIFNTGIFYLDLGAVFLNLDEAQKFFKTNDRISGFRLKIRNEANTELIAAQLSDSLGPLYSVSTWQNQNESLVNALKVEQRIMLMVVFSLVLISSFTITSSMIIKVISKIKDIGILSSLGVSPSSIRAIFVIQGLIIGAVGTIIGFILGSLASVKINSISYILESILSFELIPDSVYYSSTIPVNLEIEHFLLASAVSMSLSFLASLLPAYKASKLSIVESIRYE
jgi:lipoprotein-releasing system permease protein